MTPRVEQQGASTRPVAIPLNGVALSGDLTVPPGAEGIVLFAHGSGSSRFSPRNRAVAGTLNQAGLATLLLDLLTPEEEPEDDVSGQHRFDIPLLADRLAAATSWVTAHAELRHLPIGYFGASTGAAAALVAAALLPDRVKAVVSRGGRPDLAGASLASVRAPTLLIVGGNDDIVIDLNKAALQELREVKQLEIVPGATHLFEEPGTLAQVASLASRWFTHYLTPASATEPTGEPW